ERLSALLRLFPLRLSFSSCLPRNSCGAGSPPRFPAVVSFRSGLHLPPVSCPKLSSCLFCPFPVFLSVSIGCPDAFFSACCSPSSGYTLLSPADNRCRCQNPRFSSTRMILNRFGILLNLVIMIWQQMQSGLLQSAQLPFFTHG